MSETVKERLEHLKGNKPENLKKGGEIKIGEYGGKRKGAGRKHKEANAIARGTKEYIDKHFNEKVEIKITDSKTGKSFTIKKPRIVHALEVLFSIGASDRNPDALNKWLDRALGKPAQVVEGNEDKAITIRIDF